MCTQVLRKWNRLTHTQTELTPNASKALDKLGPFLALVCYNLQCGSKLLVIIGKPLKQWHALDQLMFLSCLMFKQNHCNIASDLGQYIEGLFEFLLLTSLSVKWDLSFSCSGVRYKVFSSEIQKSKRHYEKHHTSLLAIAHTSLLTIFCPIALCPMHT